MSEPIGKQLAIISDKGSCLMHLKDSVIEMGFPVCFAAAPDAEPLPESASVSIWLIYLSDEDQWADMVDSLIENSDNPILFGSTDVPSPSGTEFMRWKRNLLEKISKQIGPPDCLQCVALSLPQFEKEQAAKPNKEAPESKPPNHEEITPYYPGCNEEVNRVWVLGASLGGPAAVKEFIDALPEGLPIAFILAQHIDKGFQKVLTQVLGRHSVFELSKETIGAKVEYGKIYIAPVETVFDIEKGYFISKEDDWQGPYAPSIDQVIDIVSTYYGASCGTIIFSGMGSDGAIAGPEQVKRGAAVWAQTAESCANSSMPDSVRAAGCVSLSATPKQLALQLTAKVRKEIKEIQIKQTQKAAG
ncbi:MAG: chemotaxis protein CheB [Pseudomonadales bacterium]|nr:chemotaxis protein CheB [Pseudomonadales bacterium]